jgi:tRNA(Arg) A34 adenosine deaminase TadA
MCLGAVVASGIEQLLCAATQEEARSVGFDEGPVFDESWEYLARLGIRVERGIHRDSAARVLADYGAGGGPVYIPSRSGGKIGPGAE